MNFQISLGGQCFGLCCQYRNTKDCFSEFLVDENKTPVQICINSIDLLREWRESTAYDGNDDSIRRIWYEPTFERLAINRRITEQFPSFSTMLMHGVVVCDGSFAYMFTAPSGTGKSTRGQLFIGAHPDFFILNGDKPLIRVEENQVIACGSPWKGKEGYGVNAEAPLKAIFLLERADETELTELTIGEAFDFLVRQTYIPFDPVNAVKALQLLKSFEGKVRLFRFRSTPTIESVEAAWRAANS